MVASFGQDAPGIDTRLIRKTRPIPLTSSLGCGTPMSRSDWSAVPVVRFFSVANIESRLIRRRMLRKKKDRPIRALETGHESHPLDTSLRRSSLKLRTLIDSSDWSSASLS